MKKRYFVVVTVTFSLIIGCSIIFGLFGPNVSNSVTVSTLIRPSITSLESSVCEVDSPSLSVFHRELWLSAIINRAPLEQNAKVSVNINTSIQVQIPHLATAGSRIGMFKSDPNYKNFVVQMGPIHNRTIQVNCPDIKCDELFLFHLIPVDFTIYKFHVTFYHELSNNHLKYEDYEGEHLLFKIISVDFIFQYYTIEFTYMELVVKFILFVISEAVTIWFYIKMKKFSLNYWTIEQCCMAILLPLLILYNNPLYPLQYLTTNWFPSCLGYLFQITFVAVLLLVWLCIFHGIRIVSKNLIAVFLLTFLFEFLLSTNQHLYLLAYICIQSKRTFQKFYLPKICLISIFWLIIFLLITWKVYVEHHEPVFDILEYTDLLIVSYFFVQINA
ncbi:uncharacterized protein DC041_0002484 [Schistosoma bovis]|uniref:Uncharacterized protein n=1 Tax=Schistosoma bovis TaxID=6184 RepID=A0A430QHN0_SCHBO|nr:uncharacterized protein DC041_0002484 [Schistosoma bovis]